MKKRLDQTLLFCLILGAAGALLNLAVVTRGYEENGLAKYGFLPAILLPVLTLAAMALPVIRFWGAQEEKKYQRVFTANAPTAAALAGVALALLASFVPDLFQKPEGLTLWRSISAIAAALSLGFCAWLRFRGKRPVWLCWAVFAVHLVLLLLTCYQVWSRMTELNAYAYQLLATLALLIAAYQQSAADGGMGNLKEYMVASLLCVVLCPIAMIGSPYWLVFFTFWLYHTINLHSLRGI